MAKQKMKYNTEELNAMRINAMLQGIDPGTIDNEPLDEDLDIEIEDEDTPKKKKSSRKKEEEVKEPKVTKIETRPEFEMLKKSDTLSVTFNSHDIPYKNQLWGIPTRVVVYNVDLVTIPKVARDCSLKVNGKSEDEAKKAYDGLVRYYRIITYENVLSIAKELGYIKVFMMDNKLKIRVVVNKALLKRLNINSDKFIKDVQKVAQGLKSNTGDKNE